MTAFEHGAELRVLKVIDAPWLKIIDGTRAFATASAKLLRNRGFAIDYLGRPQPTLILCKLALHACGFEVQKRAPGHHSYWIKSLEFTLGAEYKATAIHLSKCSKLQHTALCDHAGVIQKQDADDLLRAARELRAAVLDWLRCQHPDLVPSG